MTWYVMAGTVNVACWVLASRFVYGSWPWEWRKSWRGTESDLYILGFYRKSFSPRSQ